MRYPGSRGIIGRSDIGVLKESTLVTLFKVCEKLGLEAGVHYRYIDNRNKIVWHNGSVTILKDLFYYPSDPDFNSFGSTEYTDALIDEAPEIVEKAFDILNSRLRWMLNEFDLVPKILITGNPGPGWVKDKYVKDSVTGLDKTLKPHQAIVLATVLDNPDPKFARIYREQLEKMSSEYDKARLLYGDWDAMPRTGMEFYYGFDPSRNVVPCKFDPLLACHIGYDFNVLPYMSSLRASISSEEGRWKVRVNKEYAYKHPANSSKAIAMAQAAELRAISFASRTFIYGDYSGGNKNTLGDPNIQHNYQVIEREFAGMLDNQSKRVYPNPAVSKRGRFMNDCFKGKLNIDIEIDPSCRLLISDLTNIKQGSDGNKHKSVVKDPISDARYEKYGHFSDVLDYIICAAFKAEFERFKG